MTTSTRQTKPAGKKPAADGAPPASLLLIEARYYDDIADSLLDGAKRALKQSHATFDVITVPGALEIPVAFSIAVANGHFDDNDPRRRYDGAIALGCVIRGDTGHYDIVANNANHWLTELAVRHAIPIGNAILTVESREQALARASGQTGGKGADAVRACLDLVSIRQGAKTALSAAGASKGRAG